MKKYVRDMSEVSEFSAYNDGECYLIQLSNGQVWAYTEAHEAKEDSGFGYFEVYYNDEPYRVFNLDGEV